MGSTPTGPTLMERARAIAEEVVGAVLAAADPARCVRAAAVDLAGDPAVIAIGKAAPGMYRGLCEALRREPTARVMVVPRGTEAPDWALAGSHPYPDTSSVRAGEAIARFAEEQRGRGFLVLLSGGASAVAVLPRVSVEEYARVTGELMRAGADISALNTVRRHIDRLKGGGLLAMTGGAAVRALVMSDVVGNAPESIGSGPVSSDPSTCADALRALERFGVRSDQVERALRSSAAETLKPGDARLARVLYEIVGDSRLAVNGAAQACAALGLVVEDRGGIRGEAAGEGRRIGQRARTLSAGRAVVYGGETTVRVGSAPGVGGRNQELALAAAIEIEGEPGVALMALGTDGVDGMTDAAGAVVSGETCALGRAIGLDARASLHAHDSHGYFAALERAGVRTLIRTGPTGTNVNDVVVLVRF